MAEIRYLNTDGCSAETVVAARSKRRQEIELLRVLSAFGIVWYHTATIGRDVAYSGLIAFLIISMYFAAQSGSPPKSVARRARVLLVPWLVWCVFYGLLNLTLHKPFLSLEHGWIAGLLVGTSIHLWYLPFIFVCIVAFDQIKDKVNQHTLSYACILLAALTLGFCDFWRKPSLAFDYPYAQYAHAMDGVLLGVFFANCHALSRQACAIAIGVVLVLIVFFAMPSPGMGVPYLFGLTAAAVTLLLPWDRYIHFDIRWLSECTLGIYLSHIFWMKLFKKFLPMPDLLLPFAVFAISAATVWLFKKSAPRVASYVV
ncbi:acyltransferase family protein [Pseudoduganella sp. FT26W]|uniref:Acyltransferase family protein n=1 Tax=Duganella aquatilis TaxID=2666082 RepID=A0A844DDT2_9BURK|nr:acyltransferase [Duganella aquatilis]MRW86250.1 acyltransferase family protein [Duganella aquatilis]